jgi:cation diffusion facilitator CzcD-associated flavoprotein CzcO
MLVRGLESFIIRRMGREPGNSSGNGAGQPLRFVIIGSGVAGIIAAIQLREAGFDNITIYEKAERAGGTWRENTYPGICCDVPSHMYRFSFEANAEWSHQYSPGDEILAYVEATMRKYGIEPLIRFGHEITKLQFVDGRWRIETGGGIQDEADIVIAATGVLHHPNYPEIAGIDSFAGPIFHTARWDHDVSVEGKRVGVIGNGSSGVQVVGAITPQVEQMTVFQRTAQWIMPGKNLAFGEDEKEEFRRNPAAMDEMHEKIGRAFEEGFGEAVTDVHSPQLQVIGEMCLQHLETGIRDPELREKLRPTYQAACKRLVISPNFYEALQLPNAEVVTEGIEAIEADGIRTSDGRLHELDIIVLATGFRVDRFLRPITVYGRDGICLDEVWAKRPIAYLSVSMPDFPNLFLLNGPNGPVGNFSLIEVAEIQTRYILQLIERLRDGSGSEIAATHAATDKFEADRAEAAKQTIWMTGCRSWYLDDRGIPAVWPWKFSRFRKLMERADPADYELR